MPRRAQAPGRVRGIELARPDAQVTPGPKGGGHPTPHCASRLCLSNLPTVRRPTPFMTSCAPLSSRKTPGSIDTGCTNERCERNGASSAHAVSFTRSGPNPWAWR